MDTSLFPTYATCFFKSEERQRAKANGGHLPCCATTVLAVKGRMPGNTPLAALHPTHSNYLKKPV